MENKKSLAKIAFILSIVGFVTGFIAIGVILDIIAIIFAYKSIKAQDAKKHLGYVAIAISAAGILLTGIFYKSIDGNHSNVTTATQEEAQSAEVGEDTESSVATEKEEPVAIAENETPEETPEKMPEETPEETPEEASSSSADSNSFEYNGKSYSIIVVDGGDQSGIREANVAVDIGYGDRTYWGLTNEYGQLVYVIADEIILQDDTTEPVNSEGRYYDDEADIPGTEQEDLDQGHVIADSLGGVSNAYNITPQNSTLNQHGDQAYMESAIREAGGCQNFVATISYPNTSTQIPSNYHYVYTLNGEEIVDDFDNVNPEGEETSIESSVADNSSDSSASDSSVDSSAAIEEVLPDQSTDNVGTVVYITNTGKKYHIGSCRYLKESKIEISLADAIAQGYEPCKVCNPPQ